MDYHNICGALRSPPDDSDNIFEHIASAPAGCYNAPLPTEFDLRPRLGSIRDQGRRPTCAAMAAAAVSESRTQAPMSPEFIYSRRVNRPASGMYARNALSIMKSIGSVAEALFPYQHKDGAKPSKSAKEAASKNLLADYAKVNSIDGLKRALLESGPAIMVLPCFSSDLEFWRPTIGSVGGGHAVTVVGYTQTGFTLRNSWSADWGNHGHVELPYSDWHIVWEVWCSV